MKPENAANNNNNNNNKDLFKVLMAKSYFNQFVDNLVRLSYIRKTEHFSSFQNSIMDDLRQEEDSSKSASKRKWDL
jgi:hypothetical protein